MSKIKLAQTDPKGTPRAPSGDLCLAKRAKQSSSPEGPLQGTSREFLFPPWPWKPPGLQRLEISRIRLGAYSVARTSTSQPWGMIRKNSRMSVSRIRTHPWDAILPMLAGSGVPWAPNPVYEAWLNFTK